MRFAHLSLGLLALLTPLSAAWSKEDREIFRIRDEIASHEVDASSSFYEILGIQPSASHDDITKAYRQLTRSLHPDKVRSKLKTDRKNKAKDAPAGKKVKAPSSSEINAAIKEAGDRQARLSLIANILRGPGRDRYDHFLAHGFPLWKGTDYYYNRYRPGLGTVLVGFFLVCGGGVHYFILYMSWKRQREFVGRYIKFARDAAWGGGVGIPGVDSPPSPTPAPVQEDDEERPQPTNRRERRMQEKASKQDKSSKKARKAKATASPAIPESPNGPAGARKRVVAENGKILVVDSVGDVYLEEQDDEGNVNEFLLDPNELAAPTFFDTAIVRVPIWAVRSTVGRFLPQSGEPEDIFAEDSDSDPAQHTPVSDSAGEDFELLEKSTESLNKAAKATGAQKGGKPNKRKNKKK